ncbi:hypothetical protein A2U01_0073135, partial [Trifolium medium]|nr:hypothetical protein [Trifolium medium]
KLATQKVSAGGNANVVQKVEFAKRPAKERLTPIVEDSNAEGEEDYMDDDDDLLDDEPDFDVMVNVVSILPVEYDVPSKVNDEDENFEGSELADYKPVC